MRTAFTICLLVHGCGFSRHGLGNPIDSGTGNGDAGGPTSDGRGAASQGDASDDALLKQCGSLRAVLRDFLADHPDMQEAIASERGLVEVDLGSDDKPIFAHDGATVTVSGPKSFAQWYNDVDGVNLQFEQMLPLAEPSPGVFLFDDDEFFPLDGKGWGEKSGGHNFHFTTEVNATFRYKGGEVFTFEGDDDLFVFINRRLALDLGGVHPPETGTIDFDAQASDLGIAPGNVYRFDAFHAERHTTQSNFRIETSIDCFIVEGPK